MKKSIAQRLKESPLEAELCKNSHQRSGKKAADFV